MRLILLSVITACILPAGAAAKTVKVDKIKKRYWERDGQFDVVQDRIYPKAKRIEVGAFGGFVDSDPFLTVRNWGASAGYHFTEYFSIHALYWNMSADKSSALDTLEAQTTSTANTNRPKWFLGGEANANFIYGKTSLLGKKILYYDMHLLGGAGKTSTENGNEFSFHIGLGQQIYVSQHFAFRTDVRFLHYREDLVARATSTKFNIGDFIERRTNWNTVFTLGLSTFLP